MSSTDNDTAPNSRGAYINGSIWALQSLSGVFLCLRIYCKFLRHRSLWWDDYLLIASWIFLLVSAASTASNIGLGFGEHFVQVPLENLETLAILSPISGFFSILSTVASKTSFATTLLRLSDGWLRSLIWGVIISVNVLMPASAVFLFASCNPPAKIWKAYLPGTCWPAEITVVCGIIVGVYSAACDFVLALLPWKILLRFRMYRKEKIGVAIAMSMGIFAGATAIVKCVMLPLLGSPDFTFDGAPFVVWGFAECAVAIMAASIPTLRALVSEVRGGPIRMRAIPSLVISPLPKPGESNDSTLQGDRRQDNRSDRSILNGSGLAPSRSSTETPEMPSGVYFRPGTGHHEEYQLQDV